ncbi:MAG: CHAD domain-containing protein [Verrucomicrobia bacterium]|nr:CHAD domain-containing protein [Verrucomicrobiota bacterium]
MKAERLFARWQRRRQRLLQATDLLIRQCQADGTPDHVHNLRVTLRRLRLLTRLGRPLLDRRATAAFRIWARRVSKATSPVRDLDVACEWFAVRPAAARLLDRGLARRASLWQRARNRVRSLPARTRAALERVEHGRRRSARLARRLSRLESRLSGHTQRFRPRFFRLAEEEQHEFRRRLRQWRYLRELALPRQEHETDRLLRRLVRAQEATGEAQNLRLAEAVLLKWHRTGPSGGSRARGPLRAEASLLDSGRRRAEDRAPYLRTASVGEISTVLRRELSHQQATQQTRIQRALDRLQPHSRGD